MHWYKTLKAVRQVAVDGLLTAHELSQKLEITPSVASAWLGKFTRWGYVVREGRKGKGKGRPRTIYRLTRWGERFQKGWKLKKVANPKGKDDEGSS